MSGRAAARAGGAGDPRTDRAGRACGRRPSALCERTGKKRWAGGWSSGLQASPGQRFAPGDAALPTQLRNNSRQEAFCSEIKSHVTAAVPSARGVWRQEEPVPPLPRPGASAPPATPGGRGREVPAGVGVGGSWRPRSAPEVERGRETRPAALRSEVGGPARGASGPGWTLRLQRERCETPNKLSL